MGGGGIRPIEPPRSYDMTRVEPGGLARVEPGVASADLALGGGLGIEPGFGELARLGTDVPADNPLFRPGAVLPSVTGQPLSDPHTDWTVPYSRDALAGAMVALGFGDTVVMPSSQLNPLLQASVAPDLERTVVMSSDHLAFLRSQATREVTVVTDNPALAEERALAGSGEEETAVIPLVRRRTGSGAAEPVPLAARASSGAFADIVNRAVFTPATGDLARMRMETLRLLGQTETNHRSEWHRHLLRDAAAIEANPDAYPPEYRRMVADAALALDPRADVNLVALDRELMRLLAIQDPTPADEILLSQTYALLRHQTGVVRRFEAHHQESEILGGIVRRFFRPFNTDMVARATDERVQAYMRGHPGVDFESASWIAGVGPTEASIFPSAVLGFRLVDSTVVGPPAPGAASHGVSLRVAGDAGEFLDFLETTINSGEPPVQFPIEMTYGDTATYHDPVRGDVAVPMEVTENILYTPEAPAQWATMTARRDPGNPSRLIVTQSVEIRRPDGTMEPRELRFFVEVTGP
ncbi:MAG TPA: hypothetical protein VLJ37_00395 [bacterium]|nr:hypothetical protein [bacterium]